MVGPEKYQDIIRQMKAMERLGNEAVRAARAAIPKGTPKAAQDDELLAYLVEKHPELPLVKRIVAAIRGFLFRVGFTKNVRPEDVRTGVGARTGARTYGKFKRDVLEVIGGCAGLGLCYTFATG